MEEIKILSIDDISFECQSIIDFSSLIKILFKLNEKEKSLEQKIEIINQTINEKEIRIKNLEQKLEEQPKFDELKIGQSFMSSPNVTQNIIKSEKYESSLKYNNIQSSDIEDKKDKEKEMNISLNEVKNDDKEKNNDIKNNIQDKNNEEEKEEKINDINIKKEKNEDKEKDKKEEKIKIINIKKEEKKDSNEMDSPRGVNLDLIKNLVKRSKEYEKRIMELTKKSNEHIDFVKNHNKNNELIKENAKKITNLQNSINDLLNKFSTHKNEFEDMKVKVQDFNIIDIINSSGNNSSGNMDLSKALIMNLENKVFKKFEFYDERYRAYDSDIFKIKEDNKNINIGFNTIKSQLEKFNGEYKNDLNKLNSNLTEQINELKNQIIELESEFNDEKIKDKENNEIINNAINDKIKESEENIKKLIKSEIEQSNKNIKNNLNKEINENNSKNIIDNENLKNLNKKLNDIEKKITSLDKIIKSLKEKFQSTEDENFKKFTKLESLNILKDKYNLLEEELNSDALKFNTIQQSYEKTRSDIANLVHKIEYVNSELSKLTIQKISSNEKPEINIDLTKYLEKEDFTSNKKEINNKFEKVRLAIENLGRNIESILTTLSHTVNEKEMTNFQNTVKNNFDELKINFSKKFADKIDTNKSLKLLDTQVKNALEVNKREATDNWLLAKKPLNNYLCASCESVIKGELDKRSDYIAWNKYPSRDDKTSYRMGHGFSKMLQMVDDSIMRSTNNDNTNYNILINNNNNTEDYNNNLKTIFNYNSKIPKMRPKYIHTINTTHNINQDGPLSSREKNKEQHLSIHLDEQSTNLKRPQILKIYKMNKNSANTSISPNKYNNSSSVSNIHRNILFNGQQKKENEIDNNIKTSS